jgi:hypothetical protein
VITSRLIYRNVKFTRLLRFPQEASTSKILLLVAVLAILGALTACGDAHFPVLTSITVAPANAAIDIGQTQQFTAVGTFSDGNTKDLSNLVTWSSSSTINDTRLPGDLYSNLGGRWPVAGRPMAC